MRNGRREKWTKYRFSTGLERSLYKALHELERRKAAREGQAVPPPAVVDVHGMEGAAPQN